MKGEETPGRTALRAARMLCNEDGSNSNAVLQAGSTLVAMSLIINILQPSTFLIVTVVKNHL